MADTVTSVIVWVGCMTIALIIAIVHIQRRRRIQRANMLANLTYTTQLEAQRNLQTSVATLQQQLQQLQRTGPPPYARDTSLYRMSGTQYPPQAYTGGVHDATNAGQYSPPHGPPPRLA
ncbi:hypothetical protein BD410DRAFT_787406 [Rickenella mellea]|uniref:Uncharacterized protein n=1 Tax=Rickenella mellea TaxID=50990 RepID=A0A4Y7Q7D9_9AGAM|nr:hypothetical protein BD410DRAFT_787406 [Rickenella mellea]